jgi:hypothetical protein
MITQPQSAFPTQSGEGSLQKQIWSMTEDLTKTQLDSTLELAQSKLIRAMKDHAKALQQWLDHLKDKIKQGPLVPVNNDPEDLMEDSKGAIIQAVMDRWSHEKAVEEMTGKAPLRTFSPPEQGMAFVLRDDGSLESSVGGSGPR